jgi:hypothetical protein
VVSKAKNPTDVATTDVELPATNNATAAAPRTYVSTVAGATPLLLAREKKLEPIMMQTMKQEKMTPNGSKAGLTPSSAACAHRHDKQCT